MTALGNAAFAVSAPGKVIVVGEHAVVHGKAAIAAAISLRSYLLISPETGEAGTVTLDFPDVGLYHSWPIASLPWSTFAAANITHADRVTALDETCRDALKPHIDAISRANREVSEGTRNVHKSAALAFLYLLLSLEKEESLSSRTYTLRSTIPIASGLGSSASISVCLSAALLVQTGAISSDWSSHSPPSSSASSTPSAEQREAHVETINNWAFVGELAIHGTPSGIDNTVSTRGRAVKFKRRAPPLGPDVLPLPKFPTLPLLLVDTKQPRSTAVEVAKVAALKTRCPEVTEHVLDAIGSVTESVHALTSSEKFERDPDAGMEELGGLIRMNHGLLATLGVSHPDLEMVRRIVDDAGVGWTKLTGAGGGGCAFSVLDTRSPEESLEVVEAGLKEAGFERYETSLGGHGVGLLDFSRLKSGKGKQHVGVEQFRDLKSADHIEKCIGISSPMEGLKDAWQFLD